jgi:hypothetical protein
LEEGRAPEDLPANKKKVLALKSTPFTLMNGYLYKLGPNDILRRCTLEHEREGIMDEAHDGPIGGHYQADTTTCIDSSGRLWWLTLHKDCQTKVKQCNICQWMGRPLWKNEIPYTR